MSKISLDPEQLAVWQKEGLEHKRYEYDLKLGETVVDLGAYQGEWSKKMVDRYGVRAICVEPTEAIHGFQFGAVINKAAGTHPGKIRVGGAYYYTSAFEEGNRDVECIDISVLLAGLEEVAVLKVNIEGSEYEILNHIIDLDQHKKIKNIQVQFHCIEGVPYELWYEEVAKKLSATHELTWRYPFVWENWKLKDHT